MAAWSDWNVSNDAYPHLESPRTVTPQLTARRRYQHVGPDNRLRERRKRPVTAPVRLKHPWGEGGGPTLGGRWAEEEAAHGAQGSGAAGRGLLGSLGGAQSGASATSAHAAIAGGDGGGGLASLFGGKSKGGPKISFRTAAALTRGLSAAQARARAMEQERIEAEREAHMQSLRTALGTPADPSVCAYST